MQGCNAHQYHVGRNERYQTIDIPIIGADGKYLDIVRRHDVNDVAAVAITRAIVANNAPLDFVPTTLLGTKDKLKNTTALVGDEIYILGYPAGLYDTRNAYPIWRIGIIATSPQLGYAFPRRYKRFGSCLRMLTGFLSMHRYTPVQAEARLSLNPRLSPSIRPARFWREPRSITYVLGIVSTSIPVIDKNLNLITRMGLGSLNLLTP